MKSVEYYERLPDKMEADQLRREFFEVLEEDPGIDPTKRIDALFELSDRQYLRYEKADREVLDAVSAALEYLWQNDDEDRADSILGVIARMGLSDAFEKTVSGDRSLYSATVNAAVEEAVNEFGSTVEDPFSGLGS